LIERARETITRVDLAFVVGNHADVMGETETDVLIVRPESVDEYGGSKTGLGARVADELAEELDA
jgi:phosphopantothenoylcysteine decarboxylase/phosphopantothenate--cysteine ligase